MKNAAILGMIALAIGNLGRMEPDSAAQQRTQRRIEVPAVVSDGGHDHCDGCDTAFAAEAFAGSGNDDSGGGHDSCDGCDTAFASEQLAGGGCDSNGGHDSCDGHDSTFTEVDGGHDSCDGCDTAAFQSSFSGEVD